MSALPRRLGRVVVLSEQRAARVAPPTQDPALEELLLGRTLGVLFQPILERRRAHGGGAWHVSAAEALVRAHGEGAGGLRPDRLLPIVERAGLMHRLFLFVLAESLAAARTWERDGRALDVAVNLHVGALLDDTLPHFLAELLDAAAFAPQRLTLEITESAPISDLKRASTNLAKLRRTGVRVALDDFGAGFSTTTRLAWLECDELKIDRALVNGLEHSEEQRCIVEHLVDLAHSRGMVACAEGVETATALGLLAAFGCDRAQGYHVARPIAAELVPGVASDWLRRQPAVEPRVVTQLALPGLAFGAHPALDGA